MRDSRRERKSEGGREGEEARGREAAEDGGEEGRGEELGGSEARREGDGAEKMREKGLGEECEGGRERLWRRQRQGALVEEVECERGGSAAAAEDGVEEARRGRVEARARERGGEPLGVGVVAAEEAVRELRGGGEGRVGRRRGHGRRA